MTELEAAYQRVFKFTRDMIVAEITAYSAGWSANGPPKMAAERIAQRIQRMPVPVPVPQKCASSAEIC